MERQRLQINFQGNARLPGCVLFSKHLISYYIGRRRMGSISLHIWELKGCLKNYVACIFKWSIGIHRVKISTTYINTSANKIELNKLDNKSYRNCNVIFAMFYSKQHEAYCSIEVSAIPLTFVLGFYVNMIVTRWWEQYLLLPWPDSIAIFIVGLMKGWLFSYYLNYICRSVKMY